MSHTGPQIDPGLGGHDSLAVIRADTRKGWMFVGATFQRGSPHCEECSYCEHKSELTTVWDGSAMEHWTECALGKLPGDRPESCPALASHLAEMTEAE